MTLRRWWKLYQTEQLEREAAAARELRQAQYRAEVAELRAGCDRLEREIAQLRAKMTGKRAAYKRSERMVRDTLTWLPAYCGQSYAQAIVAGELLRYDLEEAWEQVSQRMEFLRGLGTRLGTQVFYFFDLNHDFKTPLFDVDRMFFVPNAGIFADGRWTERGLCLMPLFNGVSPNLGYSKKFPPSPKLVAADNRQRDEIENNMEDGVDSFGPLGAVCAGTQPTFPYVYPATLELIKAANTPQT